MKKRLLSALLAVIMVLSVSVSAFAATYSDLKNHWAKEYMEELAAKGIFSGYTDGTMKPDKNITAGETLALLSRLYTVSELEGEYIKADYGETVKSIVPANYSWAYGNLEICLASGIISVEELKSINLSAEIKKERLAVYLVRALQLTSEAEALKDVKLSFADADKVSQDCRGSIAELVMLKIAKGDDKNNFAPASSVSRAVAATMISRSLDYLKTNSKTLVIEEYKGLSKQEGIITAVNGAALEVCCFDGLTREFAVSSNSVINVNKKPKALGSEYIGSYVVLAVRDGTVTRVDIESNPAIRWTQGKLTAVSNNYIYMETANATTNATASYQIPSNASITKNGQTVAPASLEANRDFVSVKLVNGVVTGITATTKSGSLSGTVTDLSYGTTVTLKMTDSSGTKLCFRFGIGELPEIKRGDRVITIDRLKTGNKITLRYEECRVKTITVEGAENTVTGVLSSFTSSTTGTVWVIDVNGTKKSYNVDDDAAVYNGKTLISLSDVRAGDQISVVIYDNTITEVSLISSSSSATKATGTVLKVDTANKLITILTASEKLEYINTSNVVSVVDARTGNTTYVSSITVNSKITAYGTYTDAKTFAAKSIIIE